jgi:hypothetical protein
MLTDRLETVFDVVYYFMTKRRIVGLCSALPSRKNVVLNMAVSDL